ncbi:efflux RND transporter permease subunit [Niabella defluvii]|nr:efflux RND transporter permease subunit [Niabella sp. I65]
MLGYVLLTKLPIDATPDITDNQVMVITVSPTLAAQEVEQLVTFPVEQTMVSIPGIKDMRSFSRFGLSIVTIVFKENVDIYWGRQQVQERLTIAEKKYSRGCRYTRNGSGNYRSWGNLSIQHSPQKRL